MAAMLMVIRLRCISASEVYFQSKQGGSGCVNTSDGISALNCIPPPPSSPNLSICIWIRFVFNFYLYICIELTEVMTYQPFKLKTCIEQTTANHCICIWTRICILFYIFNCICIVFMCTYLYCVHTSDEISHCSNHSQQGICKEVRKCNTNIAPGRNFDSI